MFHIMFQHGELVVPIPFEIGEPLLQFDQRFGMKPVQLLPSRFSFTHKPRIRQDPQMLGDGRPCYRKMAADIGNGHFPISEKLQQLPPRRIGDRPKHIMFLR